MRHDCYSTPQASREAAVRTRAEREDDPFRLACWGQLVCIGRCRHLRAIANSSYNEISLAQTATVISLASSIQHRGLELNSPNVAFWPNSDTFFALRNSLMADFDANLAVTLVVLTLSFLFSAELKHRRIKIGLARFRDHRRKSNLRLLTRK